MERIGSIFSSIPTNYSFNYSFNYSLLLEKKRNSAHQMIHQIALTTDQLKLIKEALESLDEGFYSEGDIANIQHLIQYFALKIGTSSNEQ